MRLSRLLLSVSLSSLAFVSFAAGNPLDLPGEAGSSGCNLSVMGGTNRAAFDTFDKALRAAAAKNDAKALAELVRLPLTVHRDERAVIYENRADLVKDSGKVFTPTVRAAITDQTGFFCKSTGLMYGRGAVWVTVEAGAQGQPERYLVSTINAGEVDAADKPSAAKPAVLLTCVTQKHRILVENVGQAQPRYRSWAKDKGEGKPDLELAGGVVASQGTGPCAASTFTFKNQDFTYALSELGCTDGSEPSNTVGQLTVTQGAKQLGQWWCEGK